MDLTDIDEIVLKLNYLNQTKGLIKEAIKGKDVEVADTDTFRSYAEKINNISTGLISKNDLQMFENPDKVLDDINNNFDVLLKSLEVNSFEELKELNTPESEGKICAIKPYLSGYSGVDGSLHRGEMLVLYPLEIIAVGKQDYSSCSGATSQFTEQDSLAYIEGPLNFTSTNSLIYLFSNCSNLKEIPEIQVSNNLTAIGHMFYGTSITKAPKMTGAFKTVQTFSDVFGECAYLFYKDPNNMDWDNIQVSDLNTEGIQSALEFLDEHVSDSSTTDTKSLETAGFHEVVFNNVSTLFPNLWSTMQSHGWSTSAQQNN